MALRSRIVRGTNLIFGVLSHQNRPWRAMSLLLPAITASVMMMGSLWPPDWWAECVLPYWQAPAHQWGHYRVCAQPCCQCVRAFHTFSAFAGGNRGDVGGRSEYGWDWWTAGRNYFPQFINVSQLKPWDLISFDHLANAPLWFHVVPTKDGRLFFIWSYAAIHTAFLSSGLFFNVVVWTAPPISGRADLLGLFDQIFC